MNFNDFINIKICQLIVLNDNILLKFINNDNIDLTFLFIRIPYNKILNVVNLNDNSNDKIQINSTNVNFLKLIKKYGGYMVINK